MHSRADAAHTHRAEGPSISSRRPKRRAHLLRDSPARRGRSGEAMIVARTPWIDARLKHLATIFAIDLDGFAIMDNDMHLILTLRPEIIQAASDAGGSPIVVRVANPRQVRQ